MLFEPILQIIALLVLPSEAVKSGGTEFAKEVVKNGYNVRFGRSIPSFTSQDELEHSFDTSTNAKTSKPDDFLRSLRGRDGFIRFGRGKNDNFLRFGRGKQDNFMRFGRSNAIEKKPEEEIDEYDRLTRSGKGNKKSEKFERLTKNFIRLGRGKQDNFMRFGRGKQDNFMRFGRGKQDNFMRFGRGKQDNFMRFGRGKQDNFMRFGRGKHDNFMRFGRGKQDNFMRFGRGKEDNYMRFGRDVENFYLPFRKENLDLNDLLGSIEESPANFDWHIKGNSDDNIPIAMRSSPVNDNYLDHFVSSARTDNDIRFGKFDSNQQSSKLSKFSENLKNNPTFYTGSTIPLRDTFSRDLKSKINDGMNLLRQGRHPPNKDDSFIRFGRDSLGSMSTIAIPQRRKRSAFELDESQEDILSSKIHGEDSHHIILPIFALTEYRDEDMSSSEEPEGYKNRKKRSLILKFPPPTSIADIPDIYSLKDVTSNLLVDSGNIPHTFISPLFLPPKTSYSSFQE